MATNQILNIPDWLLVGSVSQPPTGLSKIYPKSNHSGLTGSWYVTDDTGTEKRLAFDIQFGAGVSYSYLGSISPYGTRIDIQLGGGLSYSNGFYDAAPISVWGITPSMLAITGSYQSGYFLTTSTSSGEFQWSQVNTTISGPTNTIPKFDGTSLTSSRIIDTGQYVYIGSTPSITGASFSVDGAINISKGSDGYLYFGDLVNNFIRGKSNGGIFTRTTDEFVVELFTQSGLYKVIDFDNLVDETRAMKLMGSMVELGDFTQSKYLSASNLNQVTFGRTGSNFLMTLGSNTQGALRIVDGGQGSYSLLYSDSSGLAKWGKLYGYNGLTTSELGIGLNLTNIQGLTLSGGTFGLDYTKFDLPIQVSSGFTVSLATVSVATGVTYGTTFETPSFRVDQFGRIIGLGTVSTSAFTGPQGPTGVSFVWSGSYATSSTYSFYNVVEYDGSSYISLGTVSPGLTPSVSPTWSLMAARGTTGPVGTTGQGFSWQGIYATSSTYSLYNVVYYEGSSYISLGTSSPGLTPSSETQSWNILALGSNTLNVTGTYGAVLVYGETGWTALSPATAGWVLTTGGSSSLPYWSEPVAGSPSQFTFSRGFTVSLNPGPVGSPIKWFGKYQNDDFINAVGMTIEQLIYDIVTEVKAPIVNINISSPASIPFGSVGTSIVLNFDYTITNDGATAVSGQVELIKDGESPVIIWTGVTQSNTYTYVDTFTKFETPSYTFKYTVVDSIGGVGIDQVTRAVTEYVSPTITTTVQGKNLRNTAPTNYGESHLLRERGNIESDIVLTYNQQSPNIDITTYSVFWRIGNGQENTLYSNVSLNQPVTDTKVDDHTELLPVSNPTLGQVTTNLKYRHTVQDIYQSNNTSTVQVNFEQLFFFGPTDSDPTDRTTLLTLPNVKLKTSSGFGNPFTFLTGTTHKKFVIAMPSTSTMTKIMTSNLDGTGSNEVVPEVWNQSNINVDDYDGNPQSYKLYIINNNNPYFPGQIWTINYT